MRKDERVTLRYKTESEMNEALAFLSKRAKREIHHTETGFYLIVSKDAMLRIERAKRESSSPMMVKEQQNR